MDPPLEINQQGVQETTDEYLDSFSSPNHLENLTQEEKSLNLSRHRFSQLSGASLQFTAQLTQEFREVLVAKGDRNMLDQHLENPQNPLQVQGIKHEEMEKPMSQNPFRSYYELDPSSNDQRTTTAGENFLQNTQSGIYNNFSMAGTNNLSENGHGNFATVGTINSPQNAHRNFNNFATVGTNNLPQNAHGNLSNFPTVGTNNLNGDTNPFRNPWLPLQPQEHRNVIPTALQDLNDFISYPISNPPSVSTSAGKSTAIELNDYPLFNLEDTPEHLSTKFEPSNPVNEVPAYRRVHIGIYLDNYETQVGILNPETKEMEILLDIPSQVAFLPRRVVIGQEAAEVKSERNHLHILDVVLEDKSHSLSDGQQVLRLTSEDILRAYFKQIKTDVLAITQSEEVESACVVLSMLTTSNARKRMKEAAGAVFGHSRILSSLLAAGVAHAFKEEYYKVSAGGLARKPMTVFVGQSLRKQFEMALVRISPGCIETQAAVCSSTIADCSSYEFLDGHIALFQGKSQPWQERDVSKVYRRAGMILFKHCVGGKKAGGSAIVIQSGNSRLDDVYREVFEEKKITGVTVRNGPLLGACLIAQNGAGFAAILPMSSVKIYDRSRTKLKIRSRSFTATGLEPNLWLNAVVAKYPSFEPKALFSKQCSLFPANVQIVLQEEFQDKAGKEKDVVGTFDLFSKGASPPPKGRKNVHILCFTDEDGIFSLHVDSTD